jgi:hypothetical protein
MSPNWTLLIYPDERQGAWKSILLTELATLHQMYIVHVYGTTDRSNQVYIPCIVHRIVHELRVRINEHFRKIYADIQRYIGI